MSSPKDISTPAGVTKTALHSSHDWHRDESIEEATYCPECGATWYKKVTHPNGMESTMNGSCSHKPYASVKIDETFF